MVKYIEKIVSRGLSISRLEETDFSINPYVGCEHCCIYCYAPCTLHINPEDFCSKVFVKRNLPTVLDRELKKINGGHITIGTVTDAYQPAEKKYEITRKILDVIRKRRKFDISILTKSSLITRDLEVLVELHAEVGFTLITLDDGVRKNLEPKSSPIKERIDALKKFSGLTRTYVFIGPSIPNITDPLYIMEELKDIADYFIVDKLRLRKDMAGKILGLLSLTTKELEEYNKKIKKEIKGLENVYLEF